MSRNGSGVYAPPGASFPAVASTLIESAKFNAVINDISTALTQSLAADGQTTPTANLPLGGYKLTGLGAATARTDAASLATIQDGTGVYVASVGGTVDAITLTPVPAIAAYAAGQAFDFVAAGANTGAVTVNVSGLGAKTLTKNGTTALAAGDIASGALVTVRYDGTQFQIVSLSSAALVNAANTFASAQVVGSGTGSAIARLDGGAGSERVLGLRTAGVDRWAVIASNATESGSNAGSNFAIARYTDAGALIDNALNIRRSDGAIATGAATGGFQGAGSINATAVYDDGVLLTCYVPEAAQDGSIDLAKWDATVPDRVKDGKVVEPRTHEPARRFAARAAMLLDAKQYGAFWKTNRHLPALPSPAEWEAAGQKMSTGDLIQRLWETVECQAVHIEDLRKRVEALGG